MSRLALVTGGTKRIGAAIADRLAADGWTVARHAHHAWGDAIVADLAEPGAADAIVAAVIARHGRAPDLLVNNAARFVDDDAAGMTAAAFALHHAVNYASPVALALACARAGTGGAIVNLVDQRIRNPVPDQLSYSLSKGALAAATRPLAVALAPRWRVNAVAPGLTLPTDDYAPGQMERLADAMPLARLSTPDAIADAVAWLAAADAVTGQTIFVDAGAHLRSYARDFVNL